MASKSTKTFDSEARNRARAWLRYYREFYKHTYKTDAEFADYLGIKSSTLSSYLSGKRTIGLDTMAKMRIFGGKVDDFIFTLPGEEAGVQPSTPPAASSAPASPRKRRMVGGKRQ